MIKIYSKLLLLGSLLSIINSTSALAQVEIKTFDPYTEDFNSLGSSTAKKDFNNNSTIKGIYTQAVLAGFGAYPASGPTAFYGNDGGIFTGANYYSFGAIDNPDRALGGIATSITVNGLLQPLIGTGYVAMRFVNKTGRSIANMEVSYAMEQWYNSGKMDNARMRFEYQVIPTGKGFSGTMEDGGIWKEVAELNVDAPSTKMTISSKIGNAPANRRILSAIIKDINLADKQEVVLRWKYVLDKDSNGNGLSIDDVIVTPQAGNVTAGGSSVITQANIFYYKGTGNTDKLESWSTKTGNFLPKSFTADNQIFYITTNGTVALKGNVISGKNSKVIIGEGTTSPKVVFTTDNKLTTIDVATNGTLEIVGKSGILPKLGNLANGSTVHYNSDRTDILIDNNNFGNLTLNGNSIKQLATNVSLSGTLNLMGGSILMLSVHDLTVLKGGRVINDGALSYVRTNAGGALRQTVTDNSVEVFYPVGQGTYNPAWLSQPVAGEEDVFGISVSDSIYLTYVTPPTYSNYFYDLLKGKGREKKGKDDKLMKNTTTNATHTWYVSEADLGGSNVTMTLQSQLPTTLNPAEIKLNHYHNNYWDKDSKKGGTAVDAANRVYKFTRTGVTDFSPFGLGSETPLPVELSAFGAKNTGKVVVCNWTTATEKNNDHFIVQRSLDGQNFESLATVNGAGNSNAPLNYTWLDTKPASVTAYYRLLQMDTDGTSAFSPVVAVKAVAPAAVITLSPNPTSGPVVLTLPVAEATILRGTVSTMLGTQVLRFAQPVSAGMEQVKLDLSGQAPGVYLVRIATPQGVRTLRVLKQ